MADAVSDSGRPLARDGALSRNRIREELPNQPGVIAWWRTSGNWGRAGCIPKAVRYTVPGVEIKAEIPVKKKRIISSFILAVTFVAFVIALGVLRPEPLQAQANPPKYEVDPYWPKPLPDAWVTGELGTVCVDARDHVLVLNRRKLTDHELEAGRQAPPVIEFDRDGNVVNSWGDPNLLPKLLHGCSFDRDGNLWIGGGWDGMVQKYTHDGSKLLLQIGRKDVYDSSDGTSNGRALNSSHTLLFKPAAIAVDPSNGDVYIADGYGNSRVAVFDRNGGFLHQWGRQGTKAEVEAGVGGAFMLVVHCLSIGNDGLVYVCDRQGDRLQVFDKMGNFRRNIQIRTDSPQLPDESGTVVWMDFSPDPAQKYIYIVNQHNEEVDIIDHASGQIVGRFGRAGHQLGEFNHAHSLAVDSKGNVFVAEVVGGQRVQKFKIVGNQ